MWMGRPCANSGLAPFYERIVGLTITDRDPDIGMVFLSARPDEEHHELLLCGGRSAPPGMLMLQQVSFHCSSLDDMIEYNRRFSEHGVSIDPRAGQCVAHHRPVTQVGGLGVACREQ